MTELEQQVHTNGNGLETVDEDEHNKTRPADIEQVMRINYSKSNEKSITFLLNLFF